MRASSTALLGAAALLCNLDCVPCKQVSDKGSYVLTWNGPSLDLTDPSLWFGELPPARPLARCAPHKCFKSYADSNKVACHHDE